MQLPLTATLGDLHAAIQVLFGWDGDHLHVFHADGVRYSDPFYELEGTEDEEDARLRDAFPPGGPKITYVYDFGADWVHEITRQKLITLEPGQDYPVCVAYSGNSPAEYPSEDEPEDPEPFGQTAVNTAIAGILRSRLSDHRVSSASRTSGRRRTPSPRASRRRPACTCRTPRSGRSSRRPRQPVNALTHLHWNTSGPDATGRPAARASSG